MPYPIPSIEGRRPIALSPRPAIPARILTKFIAPDLCFFERVTGCFVFLKQNRYDDRRRLPPRGAKSHSESDGVRPAATRAQEAHKTIRDPTVPKHLYLCAHLC